MKFWLGVLATLLVFAPREVAGATQYETFTETVYIEQDVGLNRTIERLNETSVREAERQGMCLWEFMQRRGLDITLENVLVSGEWTDINGGACYLIGEDVMPVE